MWLIFLPTHSIPFNSGSSVFLVWVIHAMLAAVLIDTGLAVLMTSEVKNLCSGRLKVGLGPYRKLEL